MVARGLTYFANGCCMRRDSPNVCINRFSPAQPTDTWTSTANSIQRLGWYLKDVPMVLDDYKAAHVKPSQVTFLLQNYGD